MNCTCSAYPFPHRPFGGSCTGGDLLSRVKTEECLEIGCSKLAGGPDPYCTGDKWHSEFECLARSARECPAISEALNG